MKIKSALVMYVLSLILAVPLLFFFWRILFYWNPSCENALFDGLLGALLGVFITTVVALIAYFQLSSIAKTTKADFIHKLKNDFFVEPTRILIDHIVEDRLLHREISDRNPRTDASVSSSDRKMGYFVVDETAILTNFPEMLKNKLMEKRYYLEVEIDDFLLGHFEDIGLFEEKGLIDTDMAYEEFSYYIWNTFENEEIKKYIDDPDFCEREFGSNQSPLTKEAIIQLCQTVAKDFDQPLTDRSIEDLNDLLRIPDLHKKITKKKKNISFSDRVKLLLKETRKYRKDKFSKLNGTEQRTRKALNRLLLEETYPAQLPKNDYIRSDDFDPEMYSNFTYIYYKLKDFEDNAT
ncbi:MAG: hypothetical protein ABSH06_23465 [Thermodesulfobacteriota bacterium]|jgi:hypothetical protein